MMAAQRKKTQMSIPHKVLVTMGFAYWVCLVVESESSFHNTHRQKTTTLHSIGRFVT